MENSLKQKFCPKGTEPNTFESFACDFKKIFKKGDSVLEAGCCYGRYCFWLEKSGVQSVGIDFVSLRLEQAKGISSLTAVIFL
jgi:ubiquinone/menaquinone biosynthesis C-methylase UbiE